MPMYKKNRIAKSFLIFFSILCNFVIAQPWPTKPLRIIVPFSPGGSTDLVARLLGERLSSSINQPVIIDNRNGANGALGTGIAAKASGDGYTFLVVFDSHATNPSLQKSLSFNTEKDFAPISLIASSPMALVVNFSSPYQNLTDLIFAAKKNPNTLTLGSGGMGSRGHLAVASLARRAGFHFTQVSYRGNALMTDLLARQITMQMGTIFLVAPYIHTHRLRALAVSISNRVKQIPEVPTIAEQGFPGYDVNSWWGILAPVSTPRLMINQLNTHLAKIYADPMMQERLDRLGLVQMGSNEKQFAKFINEEINFWSNVVEENHINSTD